jgi:hypothetical protein
VRRESIHRSIDENFPQDTPQEVLNTLENNREAKEAKIQRDKQEKLSLRSAGLFGP